MSIRNLSKWTQNGWFYQRHRKEDLLDPDWEHRVRCIEACTKSWAYPTRFTDDGTWLIRAMKKLPKGSRKIDRPTIEQSQQLADQLQQLHAHGVIHGDVVAKNIHWDGQLVTLIDLEPSLTQLIGQRPCLMGTPPYIHPDDVQQRRLTERTDRLGWLAWSLNCDVHEARRRLVF
jgi:serine/threonine protein kinase